MKTVKFKEWGKQLPNGKVVDNKLNRDFELRGFTFELERQLAKIRASDQKLAAKNISGEAALVLSKLVIRLHGDAMDADAKAEETRVLFGKMPIGDVMYMWFWGRYQEMGKELKLPYMCPFPGCDFSDPQMVFDMDTLEVVVSEKPEDLSAEFKLSRPYMIRGKETKVMKLRPPTWSVFMGGEQWDYVARVFQSAIYATDVHDSLVIADAELNQLSRTDFKGLESAIDDLSPGPRLVIEDKCPKCARLSRAKIDWEYEDFFA